MDVKRASDTRVSRVAAGFLAIVFVGTCFLLLVSVNPAYNTNELVEDSIAPSNVNEEEGAFVELLNEDGVVQRYDRTVARRPLPLPKPLVHDKKKHGMNINKGDEEVSNRDAISAPVLTASPSVLASSLSNVTLTWSGITNVSSADFVAIYSPASWIMSYNSTNFIGYLMLNGSSTWENGTGSLMLPLVNMRANYGFAIWGNGGRDIIAVSNNVTFENINEPLQGHLALTNDPTEVIVMWVTAESATTPTVEFGLSSGNYEFNATGISYTYTIQDMCESPANLTTSWIDPGYMHEVLIQGLNTSTRYYYRFGNNITGWSPEYNFVTSPGADPNAAVNLIVYGDLGVAPPFLSDLEQQYPSVKTAHWVAQDIQQLHAAGKGVTVLHIGDISYARGYAYLWDYFFSLIQPITTAAPYMVGIGNHEFDYWRQPWDPSWGPYRNDSGGECGIPYSTRFHMPNSPPEGETLRNLWWSFDYGPLHIVFISSEHNFTTGSAQWNWVNNDLQNVNRTKTPWLVFAGHRPMYASSNHTGEIAYEKYLRESYEPLFIKYKVDISLWGHWHVYERTCGMFDYQCASSDNDATVHVTLGAAGNTWQPGWISSPTGEEVQPDWVIFRTVNYGYGRVFANSTHFNLRFYGDQRNEIHDSFWLTK